RARRGYELRENLPKLFLNHAGYEKIRHDFHRTATELFRENFTQPYYEWCEKNDLIMTGHFMAEDSMFSQSNWSGDVMAHYEFMHWPGSTSSAVRSGPGRGARSSR
ncbi:MAG: hypothetical protein JNM63_01665, partial [Spirochaetia bacterium]|nr:hypothetical protein [Spirochaetia bacterium]